MGVKAGDVWGEDGGKHFKKSGDSCRTPALLQAQWYRLQKKNNLPLRAPGEAQSLGEIQAKRLRLCGILLMMDQELQRHNRKGSEVRIQ